MMINEAIIMGTKILRTNLTISTRFLICTLLSTIGDRTSYFALEGLSDILPTYKQKNEALLSHNLKQCYDAVRAIYRKQQTPQL